MILNDDIGPLFGALERKIAREKGPFTLFALLECGPLAYRWDLVVSAPWLGTDFYETMSFFSDEIHQSLGVDGSIAVARITVLPASDPLVRTITNRVPPVEHAELDVSGLRFRDLEVRHGIVITSRPQAGAGNVRVAWFPSDNGSTTSNDAIAAADVVALTEGVPEAGLTRGEVGTVVAIPAPGVCEVKFSDDTGVTYASATVSTDHLMRLRYGRHHVA